MWTSSYFYTNLQSFSLNNNKYINVKLSCYPSFTFCRLTTRLSRQCLKVSHLSMYSLLCFIYICWQPQWKYLFKSHKTHFWWNAPLDSEDSFCSFDIFLWFLTVGSHVVTHRGVFSQLAKRRESLSVSSADLLHYQAELRRQFVRLHDGHLHRLLLPLSPVSVVSHCWGKARHSSWDSKCHFYVTCAHLHLTCIFTPNTWLLIFCQRGSDKTKPTFDVIVNGDWYKCATAVGGWCYLTLHARQIWASPAVCYSETA